MFGFLKTLLEKKPVVVVEQPAVAEPVTTPRKRLAMVWGEVQLNSGRFYARKVVYLETAQKMVAELRRVGVKCGYDYSFTGKHESTERQWNALWAQASAARKRARQQ
jgi:hypothetical protein